MPFNQQIVEAHIHDAAGQIGGHGQFGVAAAPLRRVDRHGDHVEHRAGHNNLKVFHRRFMRVRVAPGQAHEPRCEHGEGDRNHHAENHGQCGGCQHDLVRLVLPLLSLSPGHQGGDGHIDSEEQGQADKLRLHRQSDGRYRVRTQRGNHHGVNHPGKHDEKAFRHRWPGDGQRFFGHFPRSGLSDIH